MNSCAKIIFGVEENNKYVSIAMNLPWAIAWKNAGQCPPLSSPPHFSRLFFPIGSALQTPQHGFPMPQLQPDGLRLWDIFINPAILDILLMVQKSQTTQPLGMVLKPVVNNEINYQPKNWLARSQVQQPSLNHWKKHKRYCMKPPLPSRNTTHPNSTVLIRKYNQHHN